MNREEVTEKMLELRTIKATLAEQTKAINGELSALEFKLIEEMTDSGESKFSTGFGTVSIKTALHPQVIDMEAFVKFVMENDKPEFLQKKVNSAVFREYFEENGEYPEGIDAYERTTLSFRKK